MRIVFLCPRFLTERGGAELHAWQLAQGLADRGHEVTVMASALVDGEKENCIGRDARISVRIIPRIPERERVIRRILRLEERRGFYRFVQRIRKSGWLDLISAGPYCPSVAGKKTFFGYDVVALMGFNTCWEILFAQVAGKLGKTVPVVIPLLHPREPSASWPVHRRYANRFGHAVAKTQYEKDFLVKNGWREEAVFVNGVASDPRPGPVHAEQFRTKYRIPAQAPVVLFMGRKIFNKGVTHLVEAMDRVWARYPESRLILAGFSHNPSEWLDGYLARCKHDARQKTLNLDDIDDVLRENALAACTVMVLPSISDSFGIAYLDAWRHGKPVIGCLETCAQSVIDHQVDGLLVEFGNVRELAGAILSLLAQPNRAAKMGKSGQEKWNARFRSSIIAGEMEALFERLRVTGKAADRAEAGSGS